MSDGSDQRHRDIDESIAKAAALETTSPPRRRRAPRRYVSWFGRYQLADAAGWGGCEVVDVSVIGLGAELVAEIPTDPVGMQITIEVHPSAGGTMIDLRLIGTIRNALPTGGGRLRVGVEFVGLSEAERAICDAFSQLGILW